VRPPADRLSAAGPWRPRRSSRGVSHDEVLEIPIRGGAAGAAATRRKPGARDGLRGLDDGGTLPVTTNQSRAAWRCPRRKSCFSTWPRITEGGALVGAVAMPRPRTVSCPDRGREWCIGPDRRSAHRGEVPVAGGGRAPTRRRRACPHRQRCRGRWRWWWLLREQRITREGAATSAQSRDCDPDGTGAEGWAWR